MALTYRFYRADRTGDGLTRATAFRSALSDYIVEDGSGATFHDELTGGGGVRYALVYCDSTVHTQIVKDNRIQPVGPEFSNVPVMTAVLDSDAQSLSTQVKSRLAADGHPIVGTVRQTLDFLLRAVSKSFVDP